MQDDDHPTATRLIESVWDQIEPHGSPEVFLKPLGAARREVGLLCAVWLCDAEVCNGGFHQFFNNTAGTLAPEAVEGFMAINQPRLAALVTQAMEKLSCPDVRDFRARWAALERLPKDPFRELDDQYYELRAIDGGGFEYAIEQYARKAAVADARIIPQA